MISLETVLEIGFEKEKIRQTFYSRLADKTDREAFKVLFTKLSDWEKGHLKVFEQLKATLNSPSIEFDGEIADYIEAMIQGRFYHHVNSESFLEEIQSPLDILEIAISFEKDAVLFFMELLSHVQASVKPIIQKLIEEERQHIVYLIKLKHQFES